MRLDEHIPFARWNLGGHPEATINRHRQTAINAANSQFPRSADAQKELGYIPFACRDALIKHNAERIDGRMRSYLLGDLWLIGRDQR